MAITRRQFVTRLGALAAAAGFSQGQASQIMDALAYSGSGNSPYKGTFGKPRVIHCAEDGPKYLALPRGCLGETQDLLSSLAACRT